MTARFGKLSTAFVAAMMLVLLSGLCTQLVAQSLQTGDIQGTITDPSGAVVPAATVTLKNLGTGATQTTTTKSSGDYRFTLLKPGSYSVTASLQGFQNVERTVDVAIG